ncbi:cold-regulated protein [Trifolium pratense]|uniref:Cold-regulated protein n=1 Tax=Trifolium pratense TaxID=57577 RepID=A0A2K3MER3_TRIPR|nr:cold-regulated protein [Trifolium pratense]
MWKRMDFQQETAQLLNSDFKDLSDAANKLATHVIKVASVGGFGASFFGFFAAVAAMIRTSNFDQIPNHPNYFTI